MKILFTKPEDIVPQLRTLPNSPSVMQKLLMLLDDVNSGLEQLTELLRLERALAARVIQLANGAVYGGAVPCGTIEEAVQRVGYNEIYELAMLVLGLEFHGRPLRTYGLESQTMWSHSISVAIAAQAFARLVGIDERQAYAVGLLHNVGMVGIDALIRQRAPASRFPRAKWPDLWRNAELRMLGYDHADAGAAMLKYWGFPHLMVTGLRNQFRPRLVGPAQLLSVTLFLSRWISHRMLFESAAVQWPDTDICDILGASRLDLEEITEHTQRELDEGWRKLGLNAVRWTE